MASSSICRDPIFVIGSPRSGTTALGIALAQHSALWTSDESQILCDLFAAGQLDKNYKRQGTPDGSWLATHGVSKAELCRFLGIGLNNLFTKVSGGKRWIDHTPQHTMLASELWEMFPGAYFVHIARDGRRVVNSMVHYPFKGAEWSKDFRVACRTWSKFVEAAWAFCDGRSSRCLSVSNEVLSAEPERGFEVLLRFLNVPYESGPSEYFRTCRPNSSFNVTEDTRRNGDPWTDWSVEQQEIFVQEAGTTYVKYIIRYFVPSSASVLVVSKGDPRLIETKWHRVAHFMHGRDGLYAGYHPGDSNEAIRHLEECREKGFQYIVFPSSATWWLSYYREFCQYLEESHKLVVENDICRVYRLCLPSDVRRAGYTGHGVQQ